MTIHRSAVGQRVLVTLTNGDAIRGRLARARRDGIELTRPALYNPSGSQELGGSLIIPAHSIITTQVEDPDGV